MTFLFPLIGYLLIFPRTFWAFSSTGWTAQALSLSSYDRYFCPLVIGSQNFLSWKGHKRLSYTGQPPKSHIYIPINVLSLDSHSGAVCLAHLCMLRLFLYSSCFTCCCFYLLYNFLLYLCFVRMFWFIHAGLQKTAVVWFPAHEDDLSLILAEVIPKNQPALRDCSSLQDSITWYFSK